jgi:hypothetical protein
MICELGRIRDVEGHQPRCNPHQERAMPIVEACINYQISDIACWQLMLAALCRQLEQETVWDVANRVLDRYMPLNATNPAR